MKEIKAIIRPLKMQDVTEALQAIDALPGVIISEIRGFGRQATSSHHDGGSMIPAETHRLIKIEVVVGDSMVDEVVGTIQRYAHTGNAGDGKIFVLDVLDVVKIRTNIHGEAAL